MKSQKFKQSGALRYEISTSTGNGDCVHISGPFAPGDWPDISVFRQIIKGMLEEGERANVDDGYIGEDPETAMASSGIRYMEEPKLKFLRKWLRKRHKSFNGRIKHFKVLSTTFHHPLEKHSSCFRACCVVLQISFDLGLKAPFSVDNATAIANSSVPDPEAVRAFALNQLAKADAIGVDAYKERVD